MRSWVRMWYPVVLMVSFIILGFPWLFAGLMKYLEFVGKVTGVK